MLWHKGWLETRGRLALALATIALYLFSAYASGVSSLAAVRNFTGTEWFVLAIVGSMIAGSGIMTQAPPRSTKGIYGSILFTLSMPVSRLRLLAVRAGLLWIELAAGILGLSLGMWALFPVVREVATPVDVLLHAFTIFACSSWLYSIPALLAIFVDDQWRLWSSSALIFALRWLAGRLGLPDSIDLFRAMGDNWPLLSHNSPWTAMACSFGLATITFAAAAHIVQRREY